MLLKSIFKIVFVILFVSSRGYSQWNNLVTNTSKFLFGEYFLNNDTGFVFGNITVLKTIDGGISWTSPNLAALSDFISMTFDNNNNGFLVGDGVILKTNDGGDNWIALNTPTTELLHAVDVIDSLNAVAVGTRATILKTNDGGITWTQLPKPLLFGDTTYHFRTVQFINDSIGYAAGGPNLGSSAILIKSVDGGNTWNKMFEAFNFPVFTQIEFMNDSVGYASGSGHVNNPFCVRSKIIKTVDGGISWQVMVNDPSVELTSIDVVGNFIFSVGYSPTILHSSDLGNSWNYQNALNMVYPYQVFFTDSLTGYIVGDSGKVLKTTNGGVGFQEITPVSNTINIYPNPVNDYCSVNAPHFINSTLSLYDLTGRILNKQPFNIKAQLNTSSLSRGIYHAEIKDEYGKSVKGKLVKE